MSLTPLSMIESLTEKFKGINNIFNMRLNTPGLDLDSCLILGSCCIVHNEQPMIERAIRITAESADNTALLRQFATEVGKMLEKLNLHTETLYEMSAELPMLYDVGIMHETIEILRESMNPGDRDTHKYLTGLAMGNTEIYLKEKRGEFAGKERMALDMEFKNFFDAIETEHSRLEYILRFRTFRECVAQFDMKIFHKSLKSIAKLLRNLEVEPYQWEEDDDQFHSDLVTPNLHEIFATRDDETFTDEMAASKAIEQGHVYFSFAKVNHIHTNFVNEQFHHIEEHDLYAILNLRECERQLHIRKGEKNRVYHLISVMEGMVQADLRQNWRISICNHLGISQKTYNSKYTEVAESESPRDVRLKEKIEDMRDFFDELDKAS